MPIVLTQNGVDSLYLGSVWSFKKRREKKLDILKKEPLQKYMLRFWDKSQYFFCKERKIFEKKYTYEIYLTVFGNFVGPYQHAQNFTHQVWTVTLHLKKSQN